MRLIGSQNGACVHQLLPIWHPICSPFFVIWLAHGMVPLMRPWKVKNGRPMGTNPQKIDWHEQFKKLADECLRSSHCTMATNEFICYNSHKVEIKLIRWQPDSHQCTFGGAYIAPTLSNESVLVSDRNSLLSTSRGMGPRIRQNRLPIYIHWLLSPGVT